VLKWNSRHSSYLTHYLSLALKLAKAITTPSGACAVPVPVARFLLCRGDITVSTSLHTLL